MLTASYGYIGGHEGKSLYNWYLHEVCAILWFVAVSAYFKGLQN